MLSAPPAIASGTTRLDGDAEHHYERARFDICRTRATGFSGAFSRRSARIDERNSELACALAAHDPSSRPGQRVAGRRVLESIDDVRAVGLMDDYAAWGTAMWPVALREHSISDAQLILTRNANPGILFGEPCDHTEESEVRPFPEWTVDNCKTTGGNYNPPSFCVSHR